MKIKKHFLLILGIILFILSIFIVRPFITAIVSGAFLAYMFYPINRWLNKHIKKPSLGATLTLLLILLVLVVPAIFIARSFVKEAFFIYQQGEYLFSTGLSSCDSGTCLSVKNFLSGPLVSGYIKNAFSTISGWLIDRVSSFAFSLPKIFINLFVFSFVVFYLLRDGGDAVKKLKEWLKIKEHQREAIFNRVSEVTHGVVYGYLLTAVVQGFMGGLGFALFGLHSPIFWGFVMAVLAAIPYVGTGIVWVPASIMIVLQGVSLGESGLIWKGLGLFVYCLIFVGLIDNLIRPWIIGSKAKIHPALVLIGVIGGLFSFGIIGVLLGPLILELTSLVVSIYFHDEEEE